MWTPLFLRTKRISERKMPYFYVKKQFVSGTSIELLLFFKIESGIDQLQMMELFLP